MVRLTVQTEIVIFAWIVVGVSPGCAAPTPEYECGCQSRHGGASNDALLSGTPDQCPYSETTLAIFDVLGSIEDWRHDDTERR